MAAVTICSDFGAQENEICHCFHFSPSTCHEMVGPDAMIFVFWMLSFKAGFHPPLSPSSTGSLVPLHFLPSKSYHLPIWGCWYFSWQSWFQLVLLLVLVWHFVWCTLHMLNKQVTIYKPWCTSFLILNQFVVPCSVLTVASCPAYRFLKRPVRWSGIPISLRIFHSLLWSTQSKASL